MKRSAVFAAIALVTAASVPSLAQTVRTENREYRQENRIVRGAISGELTPRELNNIARQQSRIDRSQARAARDGVITPAERRRLERQQDRASRNIYRKTHNGRALY